MLVKSDPSLLVPISLVTMKPSESDIQDTYHVSSKDSVVLHSSFITHVGDNLYKLFHYEASRLHHHYCEGVKSYVDAGQRPPRTAIKKEAYSKAAADTIAKFGRALYEEVERLKSEHTLRGKNKSKAKVSPKSQDKPVSSPKLDPKPDSKHKFDPKHEHADKLNQGTHPAPQKPHAKVSGASHPASGKHGSKKEGHPRASASKAFDLDDFDLPKGEEETLDESDVNPFA